ncbi:5'-3' exonuclease [Pseudomarimonas arenosa]|uniref:Exodeoxyribonuclease IX n=1 Tax=Pseudomarimonas arenosa TaxID=2774145 RepID=A0AAW3ZNT5_9GAMM|nr:5'-3' exonuclease H3TH domain-containing protein [Pseudomarimonas arenosa]MBD8526585.1 exodeoxyribonuclease IX [Pseudomarimonas arenosa]
MQQEIVLVDASVYVFRAWHSMPDEWVDHEDWPVNAVHGFARFLLELLERHRASHVAVAFDEALESSFRNQWYPPYKANRDPAPESLKRQFRYCQAFSRALGLHTLSSDHYEADDLIGSVLGQLRGQGFRGLIVSADKDLSQLLCPGDEQWDFARNQRWGHADVHGRYGARAERIADFLALAGDAVDNIPGVQGIGAKTASALLDHFDSLESLLQRVEEIPFLRLRGAKAHAARLREQADMARLFKRVATIALDAPVASEADAYRRQAPDQVSLQPLLEQLRIGPMTRRRIAELP